MARKPRKLVDSGIYHLILRGNDQQNIFLDNNDKNFFINRINKYSKESNIELYAYCLMDNHVHFLIGNGNKNMSLFIKKLTCSYVYYFNHKYERTGHLFQGRYLSEPIETPEYFKIAYRYILQNPEKAKLCSFKNYKWSSYLFEKSKASINSDFVNKIFGSELLKDAFLNSKNQDSCMEHFSSNEKQIYDDELKILFIKQLFSINNVLSICREDYESKKQKMSILKKCGLPINQIARITGINRQFIKTA